MGDECEVASDDKVDVNDEDDVAVDSNPRDVNKGGKSTSSPIPISPDLLKQSEDKMKRNIMKVGMMVGRSVRRSVGWYRMVKHGWMMSRR